MSKVTFRNKTRSKRASQKSKESTIDVDHVARLANLKLSQTEKVLLGKQLQEIIGYVSKLKEVDTSKIEPIGHITGLENIVREDISSPSISQDDALKNAPRVHNGFFEVEAIFDEE